MESFLQARIEGEGAERYVEVRGAWSAIGGVPLLYATTTGAPYEQSEFELVDGPHWPYGDTEFEVRLFAEGGETVVEQHFFMTNETGRLGLEYRQSVAGEIARTTENGQPVAVPYSFADGVTLHAPYPWAEHFAAMGLVLDNDLEERLEVVGDPRPIETGCQQGPAPLDAEALARSIRSDPDVDATAPVAVTVGGIDALRMDVVAAPGASVCEWSRTPQVMTETNDHSWRGLDLKIGHRMRLYLLDLPGGSARILAIAIVAPEARFERVLEAAAPIVDSFEFHTR